MKFIKWFIKEFTRDIRYYPYPFIAYITLLIVVGISLSESMWLLVLYTVCFLSSPLHTYYSDYKKEEKC